MTLEALSLILAAAGVVVLAAGLRRLWRRRVLLGGTGVLSGVALLALAILLGAAALNLQTYRRLTAEREVAELSFQALGPQHYQAHLRYPAGNGALFEVRGDEWQLDARILKWHGVANLLGLDTLYRLERLSGRYQDVEQERHAPRSVHPLARDPGLDLWAVAQRSGRWLPWVDTLYGGAAYMPMADGALYTVSITTSGLVARPGNEAARAAVSRWR